MGGETPPRKTIQITGLRDCERVAANAATKSHLMPSHLRINDAVRASPHTPTRGMTRALTPTKKTLAVRAGK